MNREYFYTNDQLAFVLQTKDDESIDWEANGMTVRDVVRYQSQAANNGHIESLLPITDKTAFNLALGNLIAMGQDGPYFYRVLTEQETEAVRGAHEQIRAEQQA